MTIKQKFNLGIIILLSIFGALGFVIYFQLSEKMVGTAEIVVSILALTGVLDVFVFSTAINNSIAEPIIKIKNAMTEIGEGNFDAEIDVDSDDEIGQLAKCLKGTVQKIRQTTTSIESLNVEINKRKAAQEALQEAHNELEKRVEERTIELSEANGELARLNYDLDAAVKELSRSNKELQEFAYIVAHDLKTPLRGIANLAGFIVSDYAEKIDEQGKKQLELLVAKAKQMGNMINDILEYSKVGRKEQEPKEVDLNILIKDIISGLASSNSSLIVQNNESQFPVCEPQVTSPQSRRIEITVDDNLPAIVCDDTQILQVFQNFLTNAVKYMDKSEGRIHIGCESCDSEWKFSVSDNGPGIDRSYFEKIFKIFQTVSSKEREDSTGIGLSIVKKIVELNNGRVWLESELGKGTTFYFTFPKIKCLAYSS